MITAGIVTNKKNSFLENELKNLNIKYVYINDINNINKPKEKFDFLIFLILLDNDVKKMLNTEIKCKVPILIISKLLRIELLKYVVNLETKCFIEYNISEIKLKSCIKKIKREINKYQNILKLINLLKKTFDNQPEAIVLLENNIIKLKNKKFDNLFPEIKNYEDLIKIIDLSKSQQEIIKHINNKKFVFNVFVRYLKEGFVLVTIEDITKYEKEIYYDELTQLYNRKILKNYNHIKETKCIIMLDIDNFKKINDTHGHLVGDKVIKNLAKILKQTLRKKDFIIRWGGEEFVIILDEVGDIELTYIVAEKIRKAIENNKILFELVGNKVTCSIGICCGNVVLTEDWDKLIECADNALYKAKQNGKNQTQKGSFKI